MFLEAHLVQQCLCAAEGFKPVDDAILRSLVAKENVLGNRQKRYQSQLLVNNDNAGIFAIGNGRKLACLAFKDDVAIISAMRIDA